MSFVVALVLSLAQDPGSLVGRLGSDVVEQREEASRRLLELGEPARPFLLKASSAPDPELSSRARKLIERLDLRKRLSARLCEALPGIEERLFVGEDSVWTDVFLEATEQSFSRRKHPDLQPQDLDALAARAVRGAEASRRANVCARVGYWNLPSAAPELIRRLEDSEKDVREAVLRSLRQLNARSAVPALLGRLKTEPDRGLKSELVYLLGEWRTGEAVPELLRQLQDPSTWKPEVNDSIIAALGEIGLEAAFPTLIARLPPPEGIWESQEILPAISRINAPKALEALLRETAAAEKEFQDCWLKYLCWLESPIVIPELRRILKSGNPRAAMVPGSALMHLPCRELIPELKDLLGHSERETRREAARTLAALGDPSGLPVLIEALDDSQELDRVLHALASIDARPALPKLRELLEKGSFSPATILLSQGGEEDVQRLLRRVEKGDPEFRYHAGISLATCGRKEALPLLLPHLEGLDTKKFDGAAERLGQLGLPELLEPLSKAAKVGSGWTHYPALHYLGRTGGRKAIPLLETFLDDPDSGRRREAIIALDEAGADESMPRVQSLLTDEDSGVRRQAALWLAKRGSRDGVPTILGAWDSEFFALNALRRPEVWRELRTVRLAQPFSGGGKPGLERLVASLGLKLVVPSDFGGSWPRLGSAALTVLDALEPSDVILERDSVRVLHPYDARAFWRAWWDEESKKR